MIDLIKQTLDEISELDPAHPLASVKLEAICIKLLVITKIPDSLRYALKFACEQQNVQCKPYIVRMLDIEDEIFNLHDQFYQGIINQAIKH